MEEHNILNVLKSERAVLIGRNGSIELAAILFPQTCNMDMLELHTGVWPTNASSFKVWREAQIEAIKQCDVIAAGWYAQLAQQELSLCSILCPSSPVVPLRSLEP